MNDDYFGKIRDRFGRKDSRRKVSSTKFHSHPAEPMESPLEVLSRAATMVQDKATSESKLPNKELPTTKWRRERRRLSEYQTHSSSSTSTHSNNNNNNNNNLPTIKSRSPPPYREPLPGSTFALTLVRPTVITVGPKVATVCMNSAGDEALVKSPAATAGAFLSKRSETVSPTPTSSPPSSSSAVSPNGLAGHRAKLLQQAAKVVEQQQQQQPQLNNNNNNNNNSTGTTNKNGKSSKNDRGSESISMCDTVIDEHFRRSLGNNYMELFDKTQGVTVPAGSNGASSPPAGAASAVAVAKTGTKRIVKSPSPPVAKAASMISVSVDDHFAKALGATWNKLKATTHRREEETEDEEDIDGDLDDDFSGEGSEDQQEENDFEEDEEDDAASRIRRKNKRLRTDRKD